MLTIDNQMLGNRERDIRNGFAIPPRFRPADLAGMALKLPWLWRMRNELPRITFGNYVRPGEAADIKTLAGRMASLLDPAMTWADVEELRRIWKGPLILKGVLHPAEARAAVERGVDGLIVSNHGGRQLDGATGLARRAAGDRRGRGRAHIPVLLDGGVRRGVRCGEGAGARRRGLPHRPSAALGPGGGGRGRRRPRPRHLPPRTRPRHGPVRRGAPRRHRRTICVFARPRPQGRADHRQERDAMPDFPIVDSHVHLYDVKRLSYGWLKNVPKIARTYLLADFDRARGKVAVDKIVFAEVWVDKGLHLQEAAFVQEHGGRRSAALRHGRPSAGGEGRRRSRATSSPSRSSRACAASAG